MSHSGERHTHITTMTSTMDYAMWKNLFKMYLRNYSTSHYSTIYTVLKALVDVLREYVGDVRSRVDVLNIAISILEGSEEATPSASIVVLRHDTRSDVLKIYNIYTTYYKCSFEDYSIDTTTFKNIPLRVVRTVILPKIEEVLSQEPEKLREKTSEDILGVYYNDVTRSIMICTLSGWRIRVKFVPFEKDITHIIEKFDLGRDIREVLNECREKIWEVELEKNGKTYRFKAELSDDYKRALWRDEEFEELLRTL